MTKVSYQKFSAERLQETLQIGGDIKLVYEGSPIWSCDADLLANLKRIGKAQCLFEDAFKIARQYDQTKLRILRDTPKK